MWKWLEKSRGIKNDLLNFKDEPLSSLSVVLLIILDIFIFTNVMIGVNGETAKVPKLAYYYPSECSRHFNDLQTDYNGFDAVSYRNTYASHLRPHLSPQCQELEKIIEGIRSDEAYTLNLKSLHALESRQQQNKIRLEQLSAQYNTRLFEQIAQMPNNKELHDAKGEYDALNLDSANLEEELKALPLVTALAGYKAYEAYIESNKASFAEAKKSYEFWQPFKVYGHMLIFILPLLLLFGFLYRWSKGKELRQENYNPVVKIISAHIALILALPLVWYTLSLLYHVLPKTLLKNLIEFLVEIGLISLLNYLAIFLVVLFFGGLIYFIQKRTLRQKQAVSYSKNRQKLISWSQCFECEYKIDYTKAHCPFCGVALHEVCSACHKETNLHERFCSHCGKAK